MDRRAALAPVAALLASLVTAAPSLAAEPRQQPSRPTPLGTHLRYRTVTWTSQGADMSIMAPRHWPFVLTPEGQARFNARARPDLLSMGYRGEGSLHRQLEGELAALRGVPGLRILVARGKGRGDAAVGELRYLWTPAGGGTRVVDTAYRGNDAYTVAGPLADRRGLRVVLATASRTGACS